MYLSFINVKRKYKIYKPTRTKKMGETIITDQGYQYLEDRKQMEQQQWTQKDRGTACKCLQRSLLYWQSQKELKLRTWKSAKSLHNKLKIPRFSHLQPCSQAITLYPPTPPCRIPELLLSEEKQQQTLKLENPETAIPN